MATIEKGRKLMTLVNVFSVAPEKQDELTELLVRATEETMKHLPGFVSASIHRSGDGTKVINYAQWRSQADFEALERQSGRPRSHESGGGAGGFRAHRLRGGGFGERPRVTQPIK